MALGHGAGSRRRKERNVDELVSIEVGSCQVDHFGIIVDDRGKMEVLAIENMMIFKWSLKMLTGHNLEDATGIHWIGDHWGDCFPEVRCDGFFVFRLAFE